MLFENGVLIARQNELLILGENLSEEEHMTDDNSSKIPRSICDIDYPILCKHFGEQKARQIMLLTKVMHEEDMIRIGAMDAKELKES